MKEHSALNALGSYVPPPNKLPPPPPVRCNALLGGVTLTLQPHSAVGRPAGDVAYMRMPLSLGAMASLEKFISAAYGKDCVCTEDPKGWLKVSTPNPSVLPPAAPAGREQRVVGSPNQKEE